MLDQPALFIVALERTVLRSRCLMPCPKISGRPAECLPGRWNTEGDDQRPVDDGFAVYAEIESA